MPYRKYLIAFINCLVLFWLIKEAYFPRVGSDVYGMFLIGAVAYMVCYNVYALILYKTFFTSKRNLFVECGFAMLLMLPFILLWYFTS